MTFPKLAYCMLLVDNALILADSEEEESEFCWPTWNLDDLEPASTPGPAAAQVSHSPHSGPFNLYPTDDDYSGHRSEGDEHENSVAKDFAEIFLSSLVQMAPLQGTDDPLLDDDDDDDSRELK